MLEQLLECIETADSYKRYGKVKQAVGLMIESKGPECSIGDVCKIYTKVTGQRPSKLRSSASKTKIFF